MKSKNCGLLFCVAWAAGFICLMYHTFTEDNLDLISTLGVYALFLISAMMCGSSCKSCCKKEE